MKLHKNAKGMALLITLAVVTFLIVTALEFNRRARSAVTLSSWGRDQITMLGMASSGIHGAMALLIHDKRHTLVDSVNEIWADAAHVSRMTDSLAFEDGSVKVEIVDELSKIQVNALVEESQPQNFNIVQKRLLHRFLDNYIPSEIRNSDISPDAIVDSLKDWIDHGEGDAVTGLNGAESEYYLTLDPPYTCADHYLRDLTELPLIKGIAEKIYSGGTEKPGLSRYLTVFGVFDDSGNKVVYPGKININTAEAPVLAALLPPEYEDLADTLVEYRSDKSSNAGLHDLSDPEWYRRVPGFGSAWIDPELITTWSDLFRIESTAGLNGGKLTISAVVYRQKEPESGKFWCKVLSWQIK